MKKSYNSIVALFILISIVIAYIYFNKEEGFETNFVKEYVSNKFEEYKKNLEIRINSNKSTTTDFTIQQYNILAQINNTTYPPLYNKLKNLPSASLTKLLKDLNIYMNNYERQNNKMLEINNLVAWMNNYITMNNL
jgi:hypothetical protein